MKRLHDRDRNPASRIVAGSPVYRWLTELEPSAKVFHALGHTPEQFEDLWCVLVDDRLVLSFELARATGSTPKEIERSEARHWRNQLSQRDHAWFDRVVTQAIAELA